MPFPIKGKNSLIGDGNPLENEAKLKIFPPKGCIIHHVLDIFNKKRNANIFYS